MNETIPIYISFPFVIEMCFCFVNLMGFFLFTKFRGKR